MLTPLDIIGQAIDSAEKLDKLLRKATSKQVTANDERMNVKAVAFTWFESLRPTLIHPASTTLLIPLDKAYTDLLEFRDKSTSRMKYRSHLRALKAELIRFRSQLTVLIASGQISVHQKPDFTKLVIDKRLLSIIDRRWSETEKCLEGAPLASVVMIGALLEALLLSRIEREPDKSFLSKLKCAPKDGGSGKTKKLTTWTLNDYMNACFEMGWIRRPVKDIGGVLRDYRNLIHPREELKQGIHFNPDDAKMYWAIFSTLAEQIADIK